MTTPPRTLDGMKPRRWNVRRQGEFEPSPRPEIVAAIAGPKWSDFEQAIAIATPVEREDGMLLLEQEVAALLDLKAANRARMDQLQAGFDEDDIPPG
jgi:hypothetical protein